VALNNLGTFGNAGSFGHVSTKFGISEGAVENCTTRVVTALCKLSTTWIMWPSPAERVKIGSYMATKYFPKCIGFIDGSDATFYRAPKDDKQTYWSRKKKYCMQFQIVCDPSKLIRSLFTGYPGSVHDAKVYSASPVFNQAANYFSPNEYILGDAAYPNLTTVITPFRKRQGSVHVRYRTFNKQLSSLRVLVEHTIGLLKGRFQSLQGLRINVSKTGGHEKVCRWIQACAVLHNILGQIDPWNQEGDEVYQEQEYEEDLDQENLQFNAQGSGEQLRNTLLEIVNTMCI